MAPSPKPFSLLFLLFLTFFLQVQARESQFFSKTTRYNAPNETTKSVENQVPTTKEEYPTAATNENQNGYGLYGHETEPTTTYNKEQFNTPAEYENKQFVDNNQKFNTPAEYENKQFVDNNQRFNAPAEFGGLAGYEKKRNGMSDTRYLENGKYFYDLRKDTNYDPEAYVTPTTATATATEQKRDDLNSYPTYATEEHLNGYATEGRGVYNGVTEQGRGGYNGVTEQGRGGYNGVAEQGRGGYNGVTEQGRGGYNGPATTKNVDARSRYGGYYGSNENKNEYQNTKGGYQNWQQNEFDELKEEHTP